jgi:uncharacterized protein (TIGR03067 family)
MRCCICLIALIPLGLSQNLPSEDVAKKDLEQFQGSWKAVAVYNADGTKASPEVVQATRLLVEGKNFTLTGKDLKVSGKFTIDPASTPRTIDAILIGADGRETTLRGIYEIRSDGTRKSCFGVPGKERPSQFGPAEGYLGFEWRRN